MYTWYVDDAVIIEATILQVVSDTPIRAQRQEELWRRLPDRLKVAKHAALSMDQILEVARQIAIHINQL